MDTFLVGFNPYSNFDLEVDLDNHNPDHSTLDSSFNSHKLVPMSCFPAFHIGFRILIPSDPDLLGPHRHLVMRQAAGPRMPET